MQGTPLISPIFGTAAIKDTGLVEGTVPIRIAGGALVGPMAWSQITTTPTTLNGYGITDGVRSVGLSLPAQFAISGSPVTGTGTLAAVWASQTQSHVLAAPSNGNGTPAFRALVATDIPTLNQNTTGTAANVTGIVAIANGGTGATTDATARTALGLGTIATQNANSVAITGGSVTGITDLAIADGGTGASTAANARTNLGLDVRCLARATFNGVTLAITSSYNVSSITSPAAGVYTINLANALASANYSLVAHAQKTGDYPRLVGAPISTRTTTSLLVAVSDRSVAGTWENVENIDVAIFGA